ncbi:MAG: SPASM domain-containing protein [Candidatus Zixiibacteriota bacterium]
MPTLSRYNYFGPWRDGYYLAYNARSGAVALLTGENYVVLQALMQKISDQQTDRLSAEEQQLLQQLQYGQFVHSADLPELDMIQFESQRARFDHSSLGLVIAPTLACNMACTYCYESSRKGRMSAATIDATIGFIERQAKGLKELSISWYGGEPLLGMDIIEALTKRVLALEEQHGFRYSSMIITNGYGLDRPTVDRLRELKVYGAQVTLDGPSTIHDRKRPLVNGRPSFDIIIQNLLYAATKMTIGIRVNVDKEYSRDTVGQLLDELEAAGLRDKLSVHFALMEPATTVCSNISESCYDTAGFSTVETEYYSMLLERGFRVEKLPSPTTAACMAQLISAYVVDPDGDLYRCFNYVGDKAHACGNLTQDADYRHPEFLRLFTFDPFSNKRCRECRVLPLCMGGCPSRRLDRDITAEQQCESWRFNLEPMLDLIAQSRFRQSRQSTEKADKQV